MWRKSQRCLCGHMTGVDVCLLKRKEMQKLFSFRQPRRGIHGDALAWKVAEKKKSWKVSNLACFLPTKAKHCGRGDVTWGASENLQKLLMRDPILIWSEVTGSKWYLTLTLLIISHMCEGVDEQPESILLIELKGAESTRVRNKLRTSCTASSFCKCFYNVECIHSQVLQPP